jgi:hypothetical protein
MSTQVVDYAGYVAGIGFNFIQPETPLSPPEYDALVRALAAHGTFVDVANTRLPGDEEAAKARLREVCGVPRMSTFAIGTLINRGVAQMDEGCAFVNVGVWHGFTLLAGMAGNPDRRCIGVDNFSQFDGPRAAFYDRFRRLRSPRHTFYDMDYREYFADVHEGPIGFYLYDGDHGYEDQRLGLELAEPFFGEHCLVLVDDTNVDEPRQATLDFIDRSHSTWRILLDRRTHANGHPTWWNGVMLLQRTGSRS